MPLLQSVTRYAGDNKSTQNFEYVEVLDTLINKSLQQRLPNQRRDTNHGHYGGVSLSGLQLEMG